MDQTTTTAIQQQHPPSNNTKQGFRFHKSGNISPIPPSSSSSHTQSSSTTTTQQLSRSNSNSNSGDNISPGPGGEGRQQLQLPSNIDHKLYQIIKRITSNTPSLLVCSSGKVAYTLLQRAIHSLYQSQLYMYSYLTHHYIPPPLISSTIPHHSQGSNT